MGPTKVKVDGHYNVPEPTDNDNLSRKQKYQDDINIRFGSHNEVNIITNYGYVHLSPRTKSDRQVWYYQLEMH